MKKDKNGARPQFPEWCQAPFSLKKIKKDERREVNEYAF
jgi:hypothetical protein